MRNDHYLGPIREMDRKCDWSRPKESKEVRPKGDHSLSKSVSGLNLTPLRLLAEPLGFHTCGGLLIETLQA